MSTDIADAPVYQTRRRNVEDIDSYGPGGYHPIEISDKLNRRYCIVDKLGQGGHSTIWLARDEQLGRYVAVKVGRGDHESKEIDILRKLSHGDTKALSCHLITPFLDEFKFRGPNGTHSCLVTEPAKCSLADSIKTSQYMSFRPDVARTLSAQLVVAIAYVHWSGFVHGDIRLSNLLLQMQASEINHLSIPQVYDKYYKPDPHPVVRTDGQPITSPSIPKNIYTPNWLGKASDEVPLSEARLWLSDFGTAFDPLQETRFVTFTHLQNQPPEAIFDPTKPLTFSSDIWSLALSIWEIMGAGPFMSGFLWDQDEVIADQIDALGPLPVEWWNHWEARTNEFTEDGRRKDGRPMRSFDKRFDEMIQEPKEWLGAARMDHEESHAFTELIRGMLRFRPEERLTANQVLQSEWVRRWALPAAEAAFGYKLFDEHLPRS